MSELISFTAQACTPSGLECETVLMKVELSELLKLSTAQFSSADMAQFWAMSFASTLSLWFLAKVVGIILQVLRRG